ncbi:MAG: hypothetical protein V1904_13855 [Bacteroidota bacterium]
MQEKTCKHIWEMINVQPGYIITERCFECGKISMYFTFEEKPPIEESRDGEHFMNVMENAQSFRFDLKCTKCSTLIQYKEFLGLMMCTGCNDNCEVDKLLKKFEKERTWIYVAFGFLSLNERKQLSQEKISVLEEFFNNRRKSSGSKIKIVSYEMIENIAACHGEVIKDIGMLSLTPPE